MNICSGNIAEIMRNIIYYILYIIYVNSQIKDETALGKLMHDFACTNTKDMYYEVLADRVHYFKEDEKGVAVMRKAMEDMRNESSPYSPFNAG